MFDSRVLTGEFVYEHVKIGMMRSESNLDIIRRPSEFDGIDEFLYVTDGTHGYRLPANYPEDMWDVAERNTKRGTVIKGMSEVLFGSPCADGDALYVVTNEDGCFGAGNIIDKKAILDKGIGSRFYAIPSSVHEWILAPYDIGMDPDEIAQMIRDINGNIVDPDEQLGDRAYILVV